MPARSAAEAQRLLCGDVLRWLRGVGYNLQVADPRPAARDSSMRCYRLRDQRPFATRN